MRSTTQIQKDLDTVNKSLKRFTAVSLLYKKERLLAELDFSKKYEKQPSDCVNKDRVIKLLEVDISKKTPLTFTGKKKVWNSEFVRLAKEHLYNLKQDFIREDCVNKIENKKAVETAQIISSEVEKYEDDVLSSSKKQRSLYLIIGSAVLLVSLGMILKFNQKK